MGSENFVVDLSSDDEDFAVDVDVSVGEFNDWVDKLFVGEEGESDDLVVVDELSGPPVAKERRNFDVSLQKGENFGGGEESDDDCLVLDSDPEKSMRVVEDKVEKGDDDEEELVVVQEKGQVACRDFPHPRHHCANFPFNSSEHVQHCKLCHCYVCDCLAPCMYWGNGESPTDHCHSTDKVETWKSQRQIFKLKSISQSDKLPDDILTNVPPVQNLLHQPNQVQLKTPFPTSNPLRPCSGASSIRSHSSNNQSHQQLSSPLSSRNQRYAPCPARPNPLIPGTHAVQRLRDNSSYLAPQYTQYRTRFKRVATAQSSLTTLHNNALNGMSNNQIARPLLSRSYTMPNRYSRSQHPQPGLQAPDYLTSAATGVGTNQQVGLAVPERVPPVPAPLPGYLGQLATSVHDNIHNWPAMVASVAYDHGVSSNMTESTRIGDNIAIYPQSLNYNNYAIPQMNTDQYLNISQYASLDDPNPLGNYSSQINGVAVDDFAGHGPVREPEPSTLQLPNPLPPRNNPESSEVSLESIFARVEKEMLEEPASDMLPIPDLDLESSFFDIGVPWCSFSQIGNNS